jgi:hypothetical protein
MASEDSHGSDSPDKDQEQEDPRVEIVGRIWRMLIPVVALSIPICTLSRLGIYLPFVAIGAAGLSTACIWYFGGKREGLGRKENERLQQRIKELEERLANVETISRFEMQLAAREKAALEDSHVQWPQVQPRQREGA